MDAAIEKRDKLRHERLHRPWAEVDDPRVGQEGDLDPQRETVHVPQQEHPPLAADGEEGVGDVGRVGERWLVEVDPRALRRGGERRAVVTAADAARADAACASSQGGGIGQAGYARRGRAIVAPHRQQGGSHQNRHEGDGSRVHENLRCLPCDVGGPMLTRGADERTLYDSKDHPATRARRSPGARVGILSLSRLAVDRPPLAGLPVAYGAIPTVHIEEGLHRFRSCFDG